MTELTVTQLSSWKDYELFEELQRIDEIYFILKKRLNYYVELRNAVAAELERRKYDYTESVSPVRCSDKTCRVSRLG